MDINLINSILRATNASSELLNFGLEINDDHLDSRKAKSI